MKIRRLELDSPGLFTFGMAEVGVVSATGHFVRLRPEAETSDAEIQAARKRLLSDGARAVRVMARPPKAAVMLTKTATVVQASIKQSGGAMPPVRELMRTLVEASGSKRKAAVIEYLEQLAERERL